MILGVNRQRVQQLQAKKDWPAEVEHLASGRIWDRADIEEWARKHEREIHPLEGEVDEPAAGGAAEQPSPM